MFSLSIPNFKCSTNKENNNNGQTYAQKYLNAACIKTLSKEEQEPKHGPAGKKKIPFYCRYKKPAPAHFILQFFGQLVANQISHFANLFLHESKYFSSSHN